MPFAKVKSGRNKLEDSNVGGYVISAGVSKEGGMQEIGSKFQDFYEEIEEQLEKRKWRGRRAFGKGLVLHHLNGSSISSSAESASSDEKAEKESVTEDGDDTEKESEVDEKQEKTEREEDERQKRIRDVVEAVERTVCCIFYDRYVFLLSLTSIACSIKYRRRLFDTLEPFTQNLLLGCSCNRSQTTRRMTRHYLAALLR